VPKYERAEAPYRPL